jgi:acyl-CoA thioester hydrolase
MTDPTPPTHSIACRIYYEDTDAGGIVYHANHLKFAERGRTELLRTLGYDHHKVMAEFGILLVVKAIAIDYRLPLRLDDMIEVQTKVTAFGNTSLTMLQTIMLGDRVSAELKVTVVAVNREGRAERLPPYLRQIFVGQNPGG